MDYVTHPQKTQGWSVTLTVTMVEIQTRGKALPIIYSQLAQRHSHGHQKKQPIVALASCEIEYIVVASCACLTIWLRYMVRQMHHRQIESTQIYIDNMSAIALATKPVAHGRRKHIDTKYHFIQQHVKKYIIQLIIAGWKSKQQIVLRSH